MLTMSTMIIETAGVSVSPAPRRQALATNMQIRNGAEGLSIRKVAEREIACASPWSPVAFTTTPAPAARNTINPTPTMRGEQHRLPAGGVRSPAMTCPGRAGDDRRRAGPNRAG